MMLSYTLLLCLPALASFATANPVATTSSKKATTTSSSAQAATSTVAYYALPLPQVARVSLLAPTLPRMKRPQLTTFL